MACANCVTGNVHEGEPSGTEVVLGALPAYVVGKEDSPRIVVFGSDVFGWKFVNIRLLADEYASRGFRVIIPDLFDGYQVPQWTLAARDPVNEKPSLLQRFILRPLSLFIMISFLIRNSYAAQSAKITKLVLHLRSAHPAAKVGFVGFCWGGRYAISLNSLFDATVAAHPSLVKYPSELVGITKPISFALAATDHNYDAARGGDTEKRLQDKGIKDMEVIVYENVRHGWTLRGDLRNENVKLNRDKSIDQAVNWFKKYLSM